MSFTITAPVEGFTGRTTIGPVTLDFDGGNATADDVPDAIRTYLVRRGYTVDASRGKASKGEAFDPSAHTADEVIAYLDDFEHGSEEYTRVVQAERDGKARKGLLEAFDKADTAAEAEAAGAQGDGTQGGEAS